MSPRNESLWKGLESVYNEDCVSYQDMIVGQIQKPTDEGLAVGFLAPGNVLEKIHWGLERANGRALLPFVDEDIR